MTRSKKHKPVCKMVCTGADLFIEIDGVRIAQRGYPDTPQAKTWVSLEPGYVVRDVDELTAIEVEFKGVGVN